MTKKSVKYSEAIGELNSILSDLESERIDVDEVSTKVKKAVENLFKVEVDNVQVVNVRGKMKRLGQNWGKRKNWKKAYVSLKEGQDIDFIGAE